MTHQEAIKKVREFGLHHAIGDLPNSTLTVKAFKMAVEALEKQTPAKPIRVSNDRTDGCPICKTEFYEKFNFCPTCGKAMDWSG